MAENKIEITLKEPIPMVHATEMSPIESIDISKFVTITDATVKLSFLVSEADGDALPNGVKLSEEGIISGTPEKQTARFKPYESVVFVKADKAEYIKVPVIITIYKPLTATDKAERLEEILDALSTYWEEFENGNPLPDIAGILEREVTPSDIYYFLGRFSTLIIWNADDLTPCDDGHILKLEGISEKFNVYDFGTALVASPKELFDERRGLNDAIITARAMVDECGRREWNIEMTGYDKMVMAAQEEVDRVNQLSKGFKIEVKQFA